ncbi:DUF4351 domain-containing protein [Beggiatoa alba]|uniref:DUF4351 domain-containing protein n=1 Tax=Beggiatoa alba TaxID=1022 RepID=UPI0002EBC6E0|nr:DUF4351 domain-containing protein [Beggiatoa alba]
MSDDEILNTAGIRREWMLRQEGLQEEAQTILRLLLEKRFAHVPPWVAEKLQQATKSQLENWTLRILDAQHIEQIFDV